MARRGETNDRVGSDKDSVISASSLHVVVKRNRNGSDRSSSVLRELGFPRRNGRVAAAGDGIAAKAGACTRRLAASSRHPSRDHNCNRLALASALGPLRRNRHSHRSQKEKAAIVEGAADGSDGDGAVEAAVRTGARLALRRESNENRCYSVLSKRCVAGSGIAGDSETFSRRFIFRYRAEHSANPSQRMQ